MDTNKKAILQALEIHKGIVSVACKAVDMPRSTFYNWLNSDDAFKSEVEEIQEVALDYVEGKLFEKIEGVTMLGKGNQEGDDPPTYTIPPSDTAIIFYLKTKGKRRGYIERTEQEIKYPEGVVINYNRQQGNDLLSDS